MMNNIAEMITCNLDDSEILYDRWKEQYLEFKDILHLERNLLSIEQFNGYFKSLLQDVIDQIGLPYTQLIVQYHDVGVNDDKLQLSYVHADTQRKSCITIPVVAKEPVLFYDFSPDHGYKKIDMTNNAQRTIENIKASTPEPVKPNFKSQKIGKIRKPNQVVTYSKKHPTLVNVSNLHSLFFMETKEPRILLQISYDIEFDEIIKNKPELFRVVEK